MFHKGRCFKCTTCGQGLKNTEYCFVDNKFYWYYACCIHLRALFLMVLTADYALSSTPHYTQMFQAKGGNY